MEQHGHDHGRGHGEGHCCQGQGHAEGRGHCGRHGHAGESATSAAGVPPTAATAELPDGPSHPGRCCRDRD